MKQLIFSHKHEIVRSSQSNKSDRRDARRYTHELRRISRRWEEYVQCLQTGWVFLSVSYYVNSLINRDIILVIL